MERGLGYKGPDSFDHRDLIFRSVESDLRTVPNEFSLEHYIADILDQGGLGSCVMNAFSQGVRMCEIRNIRRATGRMPTRAPELTSRLFGYYNSRVQHGDEKIDSGTFVRLTIKQANAFGRPPESVWPYHIIDRTQPDATFKMRPPLRAYQYAADFKPAKYYRIFQEDEARALMIKKTIALAQTPIQFGTLINRRFLDVDDSRILYPPDPTKDLMAGGHSMLIIGYDDSSAYVCNSHGLGSGEKGILRFSWDYILWDATTDLWAIDI